MGASQALSELHSLQDPIVGGTLVFAVLFPTVFAFTAMSYSSTKLKPSINASYITLQPMIVAVLSLVLFGKVLDAPEIASGMVVLGGLYFTIIGNPRIDREWGEYMSDLPTNVPQTLSNVADAMPQTIATVADAGLNAVESVSESVSDRIDSIRESAGDLVSSVRTDAADDLGSDIDKEQQ